MTEHRDRPAGRLPTSAPTEPVMVSVADDDLERMDAVVDDLRRAGLQVTSVLEPVGTVTGRVRPDRVDDLRSVPGVVDVELELGDYRLPGPDDEVQ